MDALSTLDIVNSTLRQCVAFGNGGALAVQDSQLSITNSTIEDCGLWGYTSVRFRGRRTSRCASATWLDVFCAGRRAVHHAVLGQCECDRNVRHGHLSRQLSH